MDVLEALVLLLIAPKALLGVFFCICLGLGFGLLVPGASPTQATMLAVLGVAATALLSSSAQRPDERQVPLSQSTPAYLPPAVAVLFAGIWGAASSSAGAPFFAGVVVQGIVSWLWLKFAVGAKAVPSEGHALLCAAVGGIAFLLGAASAAFAA